MYPVSATYKTAVSATSRTWHSRIKITRAAQVINLTDADLKLGGLKFNEAVLASDKIALGDAVMSDIEFTILDADGIYATTDFDGAVVEPDIGLELVHPVNQVETATVAGTVTANGNASVVVTAAGMTGSPKTKAVAVVKEDTAEQVAGKIRVALAADTAVTALFTVSGWGAAIILTKITATANDSTLNVSITKGTSTGITAAPTSANTAAGVAAVIEWVPLGKYNIDEYTKPFRAVNICALDNLLKFERPFSEISVAFPCSTVTLLNTVCSQCGVTLATTSFTNSGYVINARPIDELSCRDVVGFCAQIAARFARCNRAGQLELAWFKNPGGSATKDFATTPDNRFNFKIAGESIAITGVTFETDTEMLISGTDAYTVDISSNTLIQHDIETLLNSIYAAVNGFVYVPYSGEWVGDPAVQAGDLVEHTDRDSNVHRSVIGKIAYSYRGKSTIEIGSVSKNKKGYMTSSEKQYRTLKKRVEDKQIQLDALDQAVLNGTTLIAGALGGHSIVGTGVYEGNYFIADNADITAAVKVWRGNLGGFGYSSNGVNGPYTAGISADNSIWASLVTADMIKTGNLNADLITTGILESADGNTYFDLDNSLLHVENANIGGFYVSSTMIYTGGGDLGLGTKAGIGSNYWGDCSLFAGGYSLSNEYGWIWNYIKLYSYVNGVATWETFTDESRTVTADVFDGTAGTIKNVRIAEAGGYSGYHTITLLGRHSFTIESDEFSGITTGYMDVHPKMYVKSDGFLHCENAEIGGDIIGGLSVRGGANKLVFFNSGYGELDIQGLFWTDKDTDINNWIGDSSTVTDDSFAYIFASNSGEDDFMRMEGSGSIGIYARQGLFLHGGAGENISLLGKVYFGNDIYSAAGLTFYYNGTPVATLGSDGIQNL